MMETRFRDTFVQKGDKSKVVNYRPVSLTSCCSKVMEHIVHGHLRKFLESNKILGDFQHDFRKRRSCETQLIIAIHNLAVGLHRQQQVDAILLNFSKAFDNVPHHRLAVKLHHYCFRDKSVSWIQSFIADRNQQVVLDGQTSFLAAISSGFQQGTVVGPLLFLVYINGLPQEFSLQYNFCR